MKRDARVAFETTWVVVPLFNEATVIQDVLTDLLGTFANVVCVDDGSTDDSAEIAFRAGAHVVRHPINLGQGAALRTGLDFALQDKRAEYFVTFDSDGQHDVDDAAGMAREIKIRDHDVLIGSRFLDGRTKPGWLKVLILKLAVRFESLMSGVRLTDAHNGLRVLNRHAAECITIEQNRMAHASEIVSEIGRNKLSYSEFPVHVRYTEYSRAKGQSMWNSINILSDLFLK